MRYAAAVLVLILGGCGNVQWLPAPEVGEPACTASCNAHNDQCPKVFANFPERGAIECPAEHDRCLKVCQNTQTAGRPARAAAAGSSPHNESKESRLRELKHLYEERLVSEDVYRERQIAILGEP